ncbi:AAA family ATPase [uncultured Ruminococcus sp.]|uniref:AAA family ATPase n=1 Tax=uncultured Ruminococcus sp. TaxID=165186 RepID=UPI0025E5BAB2|nr:AAA family ATPase [uncultured Ruminococcus sp.]
MHTSKITIKSLFGISEQEIGGKSVEITGRKGAGKTSVIDAIRYALTNSSSRDWIIKNGETEGEIIVETDSGLSIDRKARSNKADFVSVKENGNKVTKPETFLKTIITPLQLNPVEFTQMTKNEQNRAILDLIEFDWDLNWIKEQFGEIPQGVDYEQNILQVLNDIQAENGVYFQSRQDVNREIRNKRAFVADIAKDIPTGYDAEKWKNYDLSTKYSELLKAKDENGKIERAKAFKDSYTNKLRGLEANKEIAVSAAEKSINAERDSLNSTISRLNAEIQSAREKLLTLDSKFADKVKVAEADFNAAKAKLDADVGIANKFINLEIKPTNALQEEIDTAEVMIKHLNEYNRMKTMQEEIEDLCSKSEEYTRKIELARTLPGTILQTATLPVEGLTVENGIPLINGLPISNRSDGELLELCVDIAINNPSGLQIILIDGAEKLDDTSRNKLYAKCKEKGLQFIATRTTNDNELIVTEL